MRSEKPVFILGVGAQKSGTSWFCQQLQKSPQIDMGAHKEYHVWDKVYAHELRLSERVEPKPDKETAHMALQRLMRTHEGTYEAYFKGLIRNQIICTGDITPIYATLNPSHFEEVQSKLTRAGFRVTVVFLMRDPAERLWSAMRMFLRKYGPIDGAKTQRELFSRFGDFMQETGNVARTRYDLTVTTLRRVFDEEDLFFGLYEEMFTDAFAGALSEFLGVSLPVWNADHLVDAHDALPLPDEQYCACRAQYQMVYDFCAEQFPATTLLWRRA